MHKIGIIGAGAWGTALATVARRAGQCVTLWCRRQEVAEAINSVHQNKQRLPGVQLDPEISATNELREAVNTDLVLLCVPAQFMRDICIQVAEIWKPRVPAVICAKGIERDTQALMSEVLTETLPNAIIAVLAGPSFAAEVAREKSTAVTFASADPAVELAGPQALGTTHFRIYATSDVIGAQLGGAVKNVLAIASGIVQGRGLGDNARAALITRGLAEMSRLAIAKGAKPETLIGLSGLGDLVLTCNAMQSRNFSFGVAIGKGAAPIEVLEGRSAVTEGVFSAESVAALASRLKVEMPISMAVDAVLNHDADIDHTITELLERPFKIEG